MTDSTDEHMVVAILGGGYDHALTAALYSALITKHELLVQAMEEYKGGLLTGTSMQVLVIDSIPDFFGDCEYTSLPHQTLPKPSKVKVASKSHLNLNRPVKRVLRSVNRNR
jgi:hypothetical protein